jgi:hypothetical protein
MIQEDIMKRLLLFRLFAFSTLICLLLSAAMALPVSADHNPSALKKDDPATAELTFADLGMVSEQILADPVSEYSLKFNLPVDWVPTGSAVLDLDFSAYFSSLVPQETASSISGLIGGNLSVSMNGSLIHQATLQQSGSQTVQITFDSALITAPKRGGSNELLIRWDGSSACLMNLLSSITLSPQSKLSFTYTVKTDGFSLSDFPVPFVVENSLRPTSIKILLPASASLGEVRAALILAAGVGQISQGHTKVELLPIDAFQSNGTQNSNLILVATSEKLQDPAIRSLGLLADLSAGQAEGIVHVFKLAAGGSGLIVSGDEEGIVKAAQAVGADQVTPTQGDATMIVSAINPPAALTQSEDITLQELGVGEILLTPSKGLDQSFDFFIPAGKQVKGDSSFDLVISHSQQLDYLRSGLQLKLNGSPLVSLRLNDNTSNQNLFKLILPSTLIHAGKNTIEFIGEFNTRDICSAPNDATAWLRVSSDSLLHLPLEKNTANILDTKTFGDFPEAFLSSPNLDNVTFVISPSDIASWQAAQKLAYQLGAALPESSLLLARVTWSDAVDAALIDGADVILVGEPSDQKMLTDKSAFPSLIFNPDNSLSSQSPLMLVLQSGAEENTGYLAIRGYAGEPDRVMLAVLGNTAAGINAAADRMASPAISASNFALAADQNGGANWLDEGIATGQVMQSSGTPAETPVVKNTTEQFRQGMLIWVLPLIVVLLIVLIIFILSEARYNKVKN